MSKLPILLTRTLLPSLVALVLCGAAPEASAGLRDRLGMGGRTGTADIPTCARPLGSLAVLEPEDRRDWWSGEQLPAPSRLIKAFVSRSRCFTLVDRGAGLELANQERALGASGQLRNRSNMGKGQMRAADYALIPDVVSRNSDAGGGRIGGVVSSLIGGRAGSLVGDLSLRRRTADVTLALTDLRSSEQVAVTEGNARRTDLGWAGQGTLWGAGGLGRLGLGGYTTTEMGKVITLAYLQAYRQLVSELGGLPADPVNAAAAQAVSLLKPGRLLADPQGSGAAVRTLEAGQLLYPTGARQGRMWEVDDEMGNRGWVNATLLQQAR